MYQIASFFSFVLNNNTTYEINPQLNNHLEKQTLRVKEHTNKYGYYYFILLNFKYEINCI